MSIFGDKSVHLFTYPNSLLELGFQALTEKSVEIVRTSVDHFMRPNFQRSLDGKLLTSEKARFYARNGILAFKETFQEMGQGMVKFFGEDRRAFVKKLSASTEGTINEVPTLLFANVTYLIGRSANDSIDSIFTGLKMTLTGKTGEEKWLGVAALLLGSAGITGLVAGNPLSSATKGGLPPPAFVVNGNASALVEIPANLSSGSFALTSAGVGMAGTSSGMASRIQKDREGMGGKEIEKLVENQEIKKGGKKFPENAINRSDEVIAHVLQKHRGHRAAAAKELGYTNGSLIVRRIKDAKPGSPLEIFKNIKGKRGPKAGNGQKPKLLLSDETIATALRKHGGNQSQAAKELGYNTSVTINRKVQKAQSGSPLAPFKEIKGKRGAKAGNGKPKVSDDILASTLQKLGGNQWKTARELGYTRAAVSLRIKNSKPGSPLEPFKNTKNQPSIISDEDLAKTLQTYSGNRLKTGKELGYSRIYVSSRIQKAPSESPLKPFNDLKGKLGRIPRISDAELASTLQKYSGNQSLAAKELKYFQASISDRILRAKPGSLLEPFKRKSVSDETIATALKKHGGDRKRVAREVGYSLSNIGLRIKNAKPGSPLEPFKSKRGRKKTELN